MAGSIGIAEKRLLCDSVCQYRRTLRDKTPSSPQLCLAAQPPKTTPTSSASRLARGVPEMNRANVAMTSAQENEKRVRTHVS